MDFWGLVYMDTIVPHIHNDLLSFGPDIYTKCSKRFWKQNFSYLQTEMEKLENVTAT